MSARAPLAAPSDHRLEPERPGQARLALTETPGALPDAPVWLFLHGLGSDRQGEKPRRFRDHLAGRGPGFAALDFTGHGESGGDCRELSLTRNLEDIGRAASFLNREAIRPLVLVGSSMGGIAALWYAALHPGAVALVFAIAPAFRMAARFAASLSMAERRRWKGGRVREIPVGEDALEIGWGIVRDEERYSPERLAVALETPSLLLHGAEDAVVPVELSRDFADACAAAALVEIPGGDHRLGEHRDLLFEIMWRPFEAAGRRGASWGAGREAGGEV